MTKEERHEHAQRLTRSRQEHGCESQYLDLSVGLRSTDVARRPGQTDHTSTGRETRIRTNSIDTASKINQRKDFS